MARRSSRSRKRRRNRGRLGPLFKVLCLLALVVALTAGATVFFRVEQVVVTGNSRYTQEEIVEVTGIQQGDNLYGWNKFAIAQRLRETLPYIGEVSIRRSLPNTVIITVVEWDAVARVEPPTAQELLELQGELEEELGDTAGGSGDASSGEDTSADSSGDTSSAASSGDASAAASSEEAGVTDVSAVAQQPWLISVKGKLLEQATGDGSAISVTGLAALVPQAGTPLAVPQSQQTRLDALLSLLEAMEKAGMTGDFSSIALGSTQMELRYLDRFTVKLDMGADFPYELQVISTVRQDIEQKHGAQASGTMDLTQEDYQVVYSPD